MYSLPKSDDRVWKEGFHWDLTREGRAVIAAGEVGVRLQKDHSCRTGGPGVVK